MTEGLMRSMLAEGSPRPSPLKFEKVRGNAWNDDYEDDFGLWRHERPVDAEGPIWLYIRMTELPSDCRGEHNHKWEADLIGVSPFFARDSAIVSALESTGDYLDEVWDDLNDEQREMALCEVLIDHGTFMTAATKTSKRPHGAFKGAAQEAAIVSFMWGFAADRYQNRVGATGWDFLKGDVWPGMKHHEPKPSEFQQKVLDWLNAFYSSDNDRPDRKEFHDADD